MSQGKVKLYKNSERNVTAAHQPYVPQYQILGLDPEEYKSSTIPSETPISKGSEVNPRDKKPFMRANMATDSVQKKNSIPNVGHNRDYTWSGVDDEIIDDLTDVEVMSPMIDNNDYISDDALGLVSQDFNKKEKIESASDMSVVKEDEYVLIVNETIICSGDLQIVESQVRDLVFGDHELCDGQPIPVQELIVMKRVPIKIGVFLE
jgi:hypothetical protein